MILKEIFPYLDKVLHDEMILNNNFSNVKIGKIENFKLFHFSKLIQILSTAGSISLSAKMNDYNGNFYYLGEKLRIRKCSYEKNNSKDVIISSIKSILEDNRRGKSIVNVVDGDEIPLYTFELDYSIIDNNSFKKIFSDFLNKNSIKIDDYFFKEQTFKCNAKNDGGFIIDIDSYSHVDCLGHFHEYPVVPAIFMLRCILKAIFENAVVKNVNFELEEVDNLEMYLNHAMPIDKKFKVFVKQEIFSKKTITYFCQVMDDSLKVTYGHYNISINTTNKI